MDNFRRLFFRQSEIQGTPISLLQDDTIITGLYIPVLGNDLYFSWYLKMCDENKNTIFSSINNQTINSVKYGNGQLNLRLSGKAWSKNDSVTKDHWYFHLDSVSGEAYMTADFLEYDGQYSGTSYIKVSIPGYNDDQIDAHGVFDPTYQFIDAYLYSRMFNPTENGEELMYVYVPLNITWNGTFNIYALYKRLISGFLHLNQLPADILISNGDTSDSIPVYAVTL